MSETVKVGRNRPPQNGWASKEEVNELRAEVAELRETNQAMLEEIKGLRAELGGAKRRHFLGAVATSAAAFFGKFFHRGEDLGDFHDKKEHSKGAKKGAHAKGEEKEKEKGGTPIASARRDEKSKISREKEDKRNKGKHPLAKKVAVFALAATIIGGAIAGISQCSSHDIKGSDAAVTMKAGNEDLENPAFGSTQASAEENDAAKAEAAHQQQLAETMGMSVEDMHAVADGHGVNYNDIGTVKAHEQMRDNLESDYNLSESFNLKDKSEAEQIEWGHKEVVFANMNNMYFTAEMMAARKQNMQAGTGDSFDVQVARELFAEYQRNPEAWKRDALDNNSVLKNSKTSIRQATSEQTFSVMTEGKYDGNMKGCKTGENSGGESEYIVQEKLSEPDGKSTVVDIKSGCGQMTWRVFLRSQQPQVKERTVVQREVVQQDKERQSRQYSWNRQGDEEEHRQNDSKDPKANDIQQRNDGNFEDDSKANDNAPTYGGQNNPDAGAKSGDTDKNPDNGSEVVPDDKNGSIGGRQDAKPGQQDWGDGGGAADSGQDKTAVNPGDQGGSGKDTTGGNRTDSGSGGEETDHRSSSQHRSSHWEEGGSETTDENGNTTRKSYKSASGTDWVDDNDTHSGGDQANGEVELQSLSSVPISQED